MIIAYKVNSAIKTTEKATKKPYKILNARRNRLNALSRIDMKFATKGSAVFVTVSSISINFCS